MSARAMILAAGLGKRLLPLTQHTPKPLLLHEGRPLIDWAIEALRATGINQVVVNVYHLAEQIIDYLYNHHKDIEFIISREDELLGTGGGIKNAFPYLSEDFITINSDIIWHDATLLQRLQQQNNTLVLYPSSNGDFNLSPLSYCPGGEFVYCGIQFLNKSLFEDFSGKFELLSVYQKCLSKINTVTLNGTWQDLGSSLLHKLAS